MTSRALFSLALLSLAAPAAVASAQDDGRYFLFTGDGVAPGRGRIGLGLDAIFAVADGAAGGIPALDIRYARGLTESLDLRLSLATLALFNQLDAGVGISLIKTGSFGLGLRAGLTSIIGFNFDVGVAGVFAATPGMVATVRGDAVAFSVGVDAPMFFNGFFASTTRADSVGGFVPAIRPMVALEMGGAGDGAKFYIHGETTLFIAAGEIVLLGQAGLGVHF